MAKTKSTEALLKELKNPFPINLLKWRVGATNKAKTACIALAYIDARDVMKRLDDVCGVDGWQRKTVKYGESSGCSIAIKIGDEWVWKDDWADDTKISSIKGGSSDSFKRAAVNWGIGRYLYYLTNQWVSLKDNKLAEIPELPDWAYPNNNLPDWEAIAEAEQKDSDYGLADEVNEAEKKVDSIVDAFREG